MPALQLTDSPTSPILGGFAAGLSNVVRRMFVRQAVVAPARSGGAWHEADAARAADLSFAPCDASGVADGESEVQFARPVRFDAGPAVIAAYPGLVPGSYGRTTAAEGARNMRHYPDLGPGRWFIKEFQDGFADFAFYGPDPETVEAAYAIQALDDMGLCDHGRYRWRRASADELARIDGTRAAMLRFRRKAEAEVARRAVAVLDIGIEHGLTIPAPPAARAPVEALAA